MDVIDVTEDVPTLDRWNRFIDQDIADLSGSDVQHVRRYLDGESGATTTRDSDALFNRLMIAFDIFERMKAKR
jgi:hypothetical protein